MLTQNRKQRPSEQVMAYMKAAMSSVADDGKPVRMPSVRQLSTQLGVSRSTVAAVYRQMKAGGVMRGEVGSGSFLTQPKDNGFQQHLRVTINIPQHRLENREDWTYWVVAGLTYGALRARRRLTIQCMEGVLPAPLSSTGDFNAPPVQDTVMIFPDDLQEKLAAWAREHHLPSVHLNPPTEIATENFASADYFGAAFDLGRALRACGRKHLLIVSDRSCSKSTSNRLRFGGLMAGIDYGAEPGMRCEIVFTGGLFNEDAGRRAVADYIAKSKSYPDAIYSPGDFLALGCLAEMTARGVKCPEEVSIIGGTGPSLDRTHCPQLTRTSHPFEEIGDQLIAILLEQIKQPGRAVPGRFVPMGWLGGATTTEAENALLFGR